MSAFEGHTGIEARPEHLRRPPRKARLRGRGAESTPKPAGAVVRRRALALLALLVLVACAAAVPLGAGAGHARPIDRHAPLSAHGLLSLPGTLQGPASQTLGAHDPAYRAAVVPGGLRVNNPAQGLNAAFAASGVTVHTGKLGLGLTLAAAGYGAGLGAVRGVTPTGRSNRVTYDRGWLQEWYSNGPAGLEQGFTIPRAPADGAQDQLRLSLSISGGANATALQGGKGIRFSGKHTSLVYGAPTAIDARGDSLHSWLQMRGRRLVLRVDTRGALYPVRIDPFIQQGSKMVAGEIGQGYFGQSVALSSDGNTAAISAPGDNGGIGAVWIFTRSGGVWSQQGEKLTGGKETGKGDFGSGVALSSEGDIALVGGANDNGGVGAAWVFTRSGGKWKQQGEKLTGEGESGAGQVGDVALSAEGDTALIGGRADNGGVGAVWVFTRSGETWSQQGGKLTGGEEVGKAEFAQSVALSSDGNTALVGGFHDNGFLGAAWVFTRSGETWSQQGKKLTGGGEEAGQAWLGDSVALSSDGNTALVGGYHDNGEVGAAWVFVRASEKWAQQGAKLTGEEETGSGDFGTSVALSSEGDTALIGGYNDNSEVGAAWAFTRSGETWSQQGGKLTGGGEKGKGLFGSSQVALSSDGNTALIGGEGDDTNAGASWVFTRSAGKWTQQGEKLTGLIEREAALFGIATAISGDGKTALVAAPTDNKSQGAVWVFVRAGSGWNHQAKLTASGEAVGPPEFGHSVALSKDGNTAIATAPLDNGQEGSAWVFTRAGAKWSQQGKKLHVPGAGLFGRGVALSGDGNTAVVGTHENALKEVHEPRAFVFTRKGETWEAPSAIERPSSEKTASFGETVTISGDGQTVVVSAYEDNEERGAAWVYVKQNGSWRQQGPKLTGAGESGEKFGSISLSADGDTLLAGASRAESPATGAAYVFTRTGESWAPQGARLVGTGVVSGVSSFGTGVALSSDGNTALIGGGVGNGTGAVWEFKRSESTWHQLGEKVTNLEAEGENFGANLSLSGDGSTAFLSDAVDASHEGAAWVYMESPSLASASAAEVTDTGATLKATVNPQGEEVTECQFEYGTTTAYGSTASCAPAPESGTSAVAVSASIGGLSANTVYHFHLSSSNGNGVQQTEDQTFTTLETSATNETKEAAKPAKAEDGGLSVTASGGTGAVTIGPYGNNIGGGDLPGGTGTYFQVYHSEGSSFTRIQYKDCELGGARALWWYNQETGWEPIPSSMAVYTATPTPCVTVTATEGTTPSIAQLSDPRHVGGPAVNGEMGKCETASKGGYSDNKCGSGASAKGKGKGKFEWYAAPAPGCFPFKHGLWGKKVETTIVEEGEPRTAYTVLECQEEKVNAKNHKGLGEFESSTGALNKGGDTYTSVDKGPITLKESPGEPEPLLLCKESESSGRELTPRHNRERFTFMGCTHHGVACETAESSKQVPKTIVSEALDSYISKTIVENEKENEPGGYLEVIEGRELEKTEQNQSRIGPLMKFRCGGTVYEVTGAVEGTLQGFTPDTMTPTLAVTFSEGGSGVQDLSVSENSGAPVHVALSAAPTMTYPGQIEFGVVPSHPQKEIVGLLQKKASEKKFAEKELNVTAGETVQYQVVVYNISPFNRTFSALEFPGCEGIKPAGETKVLAGKSEVFECARKFSKSEEVAAWISGNLGFGTKQSLSWKVNVP